VNNISIDYKKSLVNYDQTLFRPLIDKGNEIYIFILTYNSTVVDQLIRDYKPNTTLILPESEINALNSWDRQKYWHLQTGNMIHEYETKYGITFDYIINTRFDLEFSPLILSNIDYKKISIIYKHSPDGNCDDNFFIIPRNLLTTFINGMSLCNITHEICKHIDNDNINYICPLPTHGWDTRQFENYFLISRIKN
jgi:hypothetical protein